MELLPCPFCGGKATFDHDDNGWYWIVCEKCGTATNSRTHTMEDCHPLLAEQWNRRAIPLHEMLDDCRKQFDDWWAEFTSAHEDWRFADSDALRWQAWQAAWNSRASPASAPEDAIDAVTIALRKAFQLGQTYWQQADSDYISQNKKSDDTYAKFVKLSEEIGDVLAAAPTPPVSEDRKDAERLNYLQEHGATVHLVSTTNSNLLSFVIGGLHRSKRLNLREAIDAALQEDKQ